MQALQYIPKIPLNRSGRGGKGDSDYLGLKGQGKMRGHEIAPKESEGATAYPFPFVSDVAARMI